MKKYDPNGIVTVQAGDQRHTFKPPSAEIVQVDRTPDNHIDQAMEVMTKAGDRIDQLRAWLDPLYKAALVRVSWGHAVGCDAMTLNAEEQGRVVMTDRESKNLGRKCDCGHDALVAAVKRAQGKTP